MRDEYRILNMPAPASGVDQAILFTTGLLERQRGQHASDSAAIDVISGQTRLSRSILLKFLQPSRRPKSVDFDIVGRLRTAYLRILTNQLEHLRIQIATVEAMGAPERAVRHLLDEAKALVCTLEALVQPQPLIPQERPLGRYQVHETERPPQDP